MLKWLIPITIGSILASIISSKSSAQKYLEPEPEPEPRDPVTGILLIGSSSAQGLGPSIKKMCNESGVEFYTLAKSGSTTKQWVESDLIKKVEGILSEHSPDITIVVLGGNDSKTNYPKDVHVKAIRKLIDKIRSLGSKPYWVLPLKLPWEDNFSPLVRNEGIDVFESSSFDIPMAPDKIHATPNGYKMWAKLIWRQLNDE